MGARVDFLRRGRGPILGWVLLWLGVLAAVGAVWLARAESGLQAELERATTVRAEAERAARAAAKRVVRTADTAALTRAKHELAWPWAPVLRAVEAAAAEPVYLLALNVDPSTGGIKIEGEAGGFEEALAFVRAMERSEAVDGVLLASAQPAVENGTGRGFTRFVVTARWRLP